MLLDSIGAFERDVCLQMRYFGGSLYNAAPKGRRRIVFCGSGDSLAASMLAAAFSNYDSIAVDPLELARNGKIARGRKACMVSVSGNTRATVDAAKSVGSAAAITRGGRLAKVCHPVYALRCADSGVFTAGSVGFLECAIRCISMVSGYRVSNVKGIFERAKRQAGRILPKNKVFLLGSQHTYPVAMYGAAKMYEVLGMDAHYERVEQFFHMGLFCAKEGDTVIILDGGSRARGLARKLRGAGLGACCVEPGTKNRLGQVLFYIFLVQHVALNLAKKKRQTECHFVLQDKLRNTSSEVIY